MGLTLRRGSENVLRWEELFCTEPIDFVLVVLVYAITLNQCYFI